MTAFAMMQAPGPQAHARRERWVRQGYSPGEPRSKRVGLADAEGQRAALVLFVRTRYPEGHAQFSGYRLEWKGSWQARRWRADDGLDLPGRQWRAVVTLKNGRYAHDVLLEAWRQ